MEWIKVDKMPEGTFELLGVGEMFGGGVYVEFEVEETREECRVEFSGEDVTFYRWGGED
jgi:hypothetical protein